MLTSAYPVFALSNKRLAQLSDIELTRVPNVSTRIPKIESDFVTKARSINNILVSHRYCLLAKAESPWNSRGNANIQSTRGWLRRGSQSTSCNYIRESARSLIGVDRNIHTKHTFPEAKGVWFYLGKDAIEPTCCPRPHFVGSCFGPVLRACLRA